MGNIGQKRRLAVTASAAVMLSNPPLAIASAAATAAAPHAAPLNTVFSCGARWTSARQCATLCPTGDDDACPEGQYCYGGTSCSEGGAEARERQRHLEQRAEGRLARRREGEYAPRFVCGESFAEAEGSCAADGAAGAAPAQYCPSGSSAQCPAGTKCYAAVPCPRSTHEEELPLLQVQLGEEGLLRDSFSFLVTEPILLNSTTVDTMEEDELAQEVKVAGEISGWSFFAREPSSAILETMSVLLSSRYGAN